VVKDDGNCFRVAAADFTDIAAAIEAMEEPPLD